MLNEIEKLSISERIQLVEDIWDGIVATPEAVPVTPEQRDELRRRVREYRRNPREGVSWEQLKAKMKDS